MYAKGTVNGFKPLSDGMLLLSALLNNKLALRVWRGNKEKKSKGVVSVSADVPERAWNIGGMLESTTSCSFYYLSAA